MLDEVLNLVRVTESAAVAAADWIGTGDKLNADKAATDAVRSRLNQLDFAGQIIMGEGKKDRSYGLFSGEIVGVRREDKKHVSVDIAVDPIDGTRPTAMAGPEAMSVVAVAEKDALFSTEEFYMHKVAYGPEIANIAPIHLKDPIPEIVKKVTKAKGKEVSQIVVCLLDRPRHQAFIDEFRNAGVRIKLIQDCDVSAAIATCLPESGIDVSYGIGGAPEAVITACAMKCLKGGFETQLADGKGNMLAPKIYAIDDMVKSKCAFSATGVTNGSLLKGVINNEREIVTYSVVMRCETGTVRWIKAHHRKPLA